MDTSKRMIKIGPAGDPSCYGRDWDEKGRSEIVQIFVSHDNLIRSIQFQYHENNVLVLSETFGEHNGQNFEVVSFQYPSEYLVCISGHRSTAGRLSSLVFGTNLGTHGPVGIPDEADKEFRFHLGMNRQFGGFYGNLASGGYLQSIGVYCKPNTCFPRKTEGIVLCRP